MEYLKARSGACGKEYLYELVDSGIDADGSALTLTDPDELGVGTMNSVDVCSTSRRLRGQSVASDRKVVLVGGTNAYASSRATAWL